MSSRTTGSRSSTSSASSFPTPPYPSGYPPPPYPPPPYPPPPYPPPPYPPPPYPPPPFPVTQTVTATVVTGSDASNAIVSTATNTVITTSNGQPFTIVQVSTVLSTRAGVAANPTSASSTASSSNNSHAGIIGGIIGAVVALIALISLLYFCLRRRRRRRTNSVDADSIADKVTSTHHVNLTEETTSLPLVITPFPPQSPSSSGGSDSSRRVRPGDQDSLAHARVGSGSVYVAGDPRATPHPPPPPSESMYSSEEHTDISSVVFSPSGPPSEPGSTDTAAVNVSPLNATRSRSGWTPLLVFNDPGTGGVARSSTKAREARSRFTGGLTLSTPLEGEEQGEDSESQRSTLQQSATPLPTPPQSPIIVHEDGGALEQPCSDQKPEEIPPAYHSLPT